MENMADEPPVAGSEQTRQRLIDAGLLLFGEAGLHGTSTRALAETAGVNLNAILYHFGGKDGLYKAVAHHVAETTGAMIRSAATRHIAPDALDPEEAASTAAAIVSSIAAVILGAPDATARGSFIIREQLQPTVAFDVLYEGFIGPAHRALTNLVARTLDLPGDDPAAVLHAHGLLGQALIFVLARATLLRRLGDDTLSTERIDAIVRSVETQVAATLEGLRSREKG